MAHALAARGWHYERREGELNTSTDAEKSMIESKIGRPLEGRVIRLKEGAQAYTATFYGQPEIAKKNVKKIFDSVEDGGYFEKIFSSDMTAEKMIVAHELKTYIDDFLRPFAGLYRKSQKLSSGDAGRILATLLGDSLVSRHKDMVHQVVPQCSLFLCGTVFVGLVEYQQIPPERISEELKQRGRVIIQEHLMHIIDFFKQNKDKADRSWPVLLKSNAFFGHVTAYIFGVRNGAKR